MDKLDKDIAELKEAISKFIISYDGDEDKQASQLVFYLKGTLEIEEFKLSKEDYDEVNESYYDSGCLFYNDDVDNSEDDE